MRSRWRSYFLLLSFTALLWSFIGCSDKIDYKALMDEHQNLAGALRDNKLYAAAIEEYQKILELSQADTPTRANVNYLMGKIYFENLQDYPQAAAYYVRAKELDPNGSFVPEASKNLVASLERMGHILDARRELNALTDIDAAAPAKGDVALAKIGTVPIWRSEIEAQLQSLPPELQKQFVNKKEKADFLRNYVGMELLYRAAVRENYDNDPEIKRRQHQLLKKLLVDKYLVERVIPEIKIDTLDVRNFYQANKDQRYDNAPYDSVKAQVFMDYQQTKAQSAFTDYISKLAQIEKVEFYEQNLK